MYQVSPLFAMLFLTAMHGESAQKQKKNELPEHDDRCVIFYSERCSFLKTACPIGQPRDNSLFPQTDTLLARQSGHGYCRALHEECRPTYKISG